MLFYFNSYCHLSLVSSSILPFFSPPLLFFQLKREEKAKKKKKKESGKWGKLLEICKYYGSCSLVSKFLTVPIGRQFIGFEVKGAKEDLKVKVDLLKKEKYVEKIKNRVKPWQKEVNSIIDEAKNLIFLKKAKITYTKVGKVISIIG